MTALGLVTFSKECSLIDAKLTEAEVSLAFAKVKLGRTKTLKFDRFQEACRAMANTKGVTYQNIIQLATGEELNLDEEATDHFDVEAGLGMDKKSKKKLTVEDFDLLKVLGKGGFGKVMLVKLKSDPSGELLAMKSLRKAALIKRKQLEHTETERKIAQTIQHPFLVNLRYAFQTVDKLYLVLDYMGGGEIFFWLQKQRRFSKNRVRLYMAQMTLALEALHSQDIVYRDLKSENTLLDLNGNLRLTDFGLAKENVKANTGAATFCGTPEYLAPEVLQNLGHGKGVDWWAMGTLCYEMIHGLPPFYDQNMQRMYQNILEEKLAWKGPLATPEHEDTREILAGLLCREPAQRLGGSSEGCSDIKAHRFFSSLDFDKVLKKEYTPEFVPPVAHEGDTSNFDKEFTNQRAMDSVVTTNLDQKEIDATKFEGFTFTTGPEHMK
jgi:serine/threonine protein kinase